ncbi:hypothetical protein E1B28_010755 [Marasmius oreades]|uniref:Uncharacterized protein n=1 Tax=Marasmius oreades TaxID=181124 RepID=A0A9P7UPI7_9AGAR|nr:uncharacterized protein E1B28_010755 [Marasmius oreades]KAG7089045.1 hypothetical protein E1B28_010755 [Marasmius oreades]
MFRCGGNRALPRRNRRTKSQRNSKSSVHHVDAHLGGPDGDAEDPLKAIQESIGKYRYMDANLTQRRHGLEEKIIDIIEYGAIPEQ